MSDIISAFLRADQVYEKVFVGIFRYAAPILACVLLLRCVYPLLSFRREPEIWAWLHLAGNRKLPVTHWDNVIGRSKHSDIVIDFPTVSRSHCVLNHISKGGWVIVDTDSKDGVYVNGNRVPTCAVNAEDIISVGGVEMRLKPITAEQERQLSQLRTKASSVLSSIANVFLLTIFQLLCCMAFLLGGNEQYIGDVLFGFAGIVFSQWMLLVFYCGLQRTSFEIETIAFFLCTLGMAGIATVTPGEAVKQMISMMMGIFLFLVIGWSLRSLETAKIIRRIAAYAGVGLLVITLLFGQTYYGAKNWLLIGSLSVQPSELTKVCFVFVGASAMDRILTKRNLILFIMYSAVICGCLALMNDFGTALIFFFAFLVIAYMRSGSLGTIGLACTALAFAGVVALKIAPHALQRFTSWRHIWEDPLNAGYQQTRALMCMASGGLLGIGPGKGLMKTLFAADSDMVVATLSEEWGLSMLAVAILCVIALAVFSVRAAAIGRSSFYIIGACTASGILVVQTILNALGAVDVLPLTGVTFPFLSNGGSSMICAWGLLAFIKAADTRRDASFAVRRRNG